MVRPVFRLCATASLLACAAWAVLGQVWVGSEPGILVRSDNTNRDCGSVLMNSNGVYNGAYAWQLDGVAPPYYGAFAEKYSAHVMICGIVLDITSFGYQHGQTLDAYVWSDDEGVPGDVVCMVPGIDPGPVAWWPDVSRDYLDFPASCPSPDAWWIGYWGDWPGEVFGWAIGASYYEPLDGFPFTNVAPGVHYPTGWHDVSVIWGPTEALGVGAQVNPIPTPSAERSWGRVKALFGR